VRHFGLLCLQHACTVEWNRLGDPQKQFLKQVALELLAAGNETVLIGVLHYARSDASIRP